MKALSTIVLTLALTVFCLAADDPPEEIEEVENIPTPSAGATAPDDAAPSPPPDPVLGALRWLQSIQLDNGSWENSPAHTGLALISFLNNGETPLSFEFGETVKAATLWLAHTAPETGIWGPTGQAAVYHHGIATYAIAEGYAMTQMPMLKAPLDQLVATIIAGQQPGGGWDYLYAKGARWDLSVSAWQIRALKSAYAGGAEHPSLRTSLERAAQFVKSAHREGRFGYTRRGLDPSGNLTGIGAYCLQALGEGRSPEAAEATRWIFTNRLSTIVDADDHWQKHRRDLYGWHFDTQAIFHHNGTLWHKWSAAFQEPIIKNQHPDGYWTFDPPVRFKIGGQSNRGKLIATCLTVHQLQNFYAYQPITKRPLPAKAPLRTDASTELEIE